MANNDNGSITIYVTNGTFTGGGGNGGNGGNNVNPNNINPNGGGNGGGGGGGGGMPSQQQRTSKPRNNSQGMTRYMAMRIAETATNTAKQIINFNVSQIGNRTGEYQAQQDINAQLGVIEPAVTTATATAINLAYGNYPYALLSLVQGIGTFAIQLIENVVSNQTINANQNINSNMLLARSGLQSSNNNSRGTEN